MVDAYEKPPTSLPWRFQTENTASSWRVKYTDGGLLDEVGRFHIVSAYTNVARFRNYMFFVDWWNHYRVGMERNVRGVCDGTILITRVNEWSRVRWANFVSSGRMSEGVKFPPQRLFSRTVLLTTTFMPPSKTPANSTPLQLHRARRWQTNFEDDSLVRN